ncbi:unnamed protein product [Trichogramma brassicae]|uniref:Uncharacterized protein n=1 Tax=Trichogramma brassicae TaxID=86971 RepID=A0A6H5ITL7_9HYME|nr:unnamed protein product [Trichogramma brassicae]
MDVGAVGGLRNVKDAISVARKVMENTRHSLLGGELAADFARQMGFTKESLQTEKSKKMFDDWVQNRCQPNFWEANVEPNPAESCGPYRQAQQQQVETNIDRAERQLPQSGEDQHDTIGVVALDTRGRLVSGVSTNGQNHKIAGRIGDSAVTGAGAYADGDVGAAAATGDGDIIMRFLPRYSILFGGGTDASGRLAASRHGDGGEAHGSQVSALPRRGHCSEQARRVRCVLPWL